MKFGFSGSRKRACLQKEALLFQANGCPSIKVNEVWVLWFKKKSLPGKEALLFQANGRPLIEKIEV
jgi:hypothetical protein